MPFFVQFRSFSFGVTVDLFCINTILQGQLRDTLAREGRPEEIADGRWSKTGWVFGTLQCVHWMGSMWNVTKQNISHVFAIAKILELKSFGIVYWWAMVTSQQWGQQHGIVMLSFTVLLIFQINCCHTQLQLLSAYWWHSLLELCVVLCSLSACIKQPF